MSPIDRLQQLFERFPGIGPRQAGRFVQYLLIATPGMRTELAEAISALGSETNQCKKCFRWFARGEKTGLCNICTNANRDASVLFVIEKDADIEPVERSGFKGLYFVLGGTIPLGSEEPGKFVRLRELTKRAEDAGLREIILGLSATTEGDHTRQIIQETLKNTVAKLSSLGRGLSTGSELEYVDPDTIHQALANRN
jgi:recombination protein RecR